MPSAPDRSGEQRALYRLRRALHNGGNLSYAVIAGITGRSRRQNQRLIQILRDAGEAIEEYTEGKIKIFYIPEDHREAAFQVHLSAEEMLGLIVAADASLASLGPTPLGESLRGAIHELTERADGEFYHIDLEAEPSEHYHFNATPSANLDPQVFRALQEAIRTRTTVEVTYYTASRMKSGDRKFDPYAFAAPGGSWMLLAWCRRHRSFRHFSISDISNVRPTGTPFLRRKVDMAAYFRDYFGGVGGGTIYDVRLAVSPKYVAAFRRKKYHASQSLQMHDDGSATVSFRVAGLDDIRPFVLSYGRGVRVISPPELVEMVTEEVRVVGGMYGGGGLA